MFNPTLAQALRKAGVVDEQNRVADTVRRHKPNRRPTRAHKRAKQESRDVTPLKAA